MKKRFLAIVIGFVFLLQMGLSISVQAEGEDLTILPEYIVTEDEIDEYDSVTYEKVASNQDSILYADTTKGLFAFQNRKSGHIWYSTPNDVLQDEATIGINKWTIRSQLVLRYIYAEDLLNTSSVSTITSQLGCVKNGSVAVSVLGDGIRVVYGFDELGIKVPVEYRLKEDSLVASIDLDGIDEGEECLITDINLLPAFGAGNSVAQGQLFVPDGCGALINFNNGIKGAVYEEMIYGDDRLVFKEIDNTKKETIRLPVFATITEGNALMGIVTEGDDSAAIRAINGNEDNGYNAVSTVCKLRTLELLDMFNGTSNYRVISRLSPWAEDASTYEVMYTPLTGESASYVGVAKRYRQYLIDEKGLKPQVEQPALQLDMYGSIDVKAAFLGIQYSKQQTLTTFSQAQTILKQLKEQCDVPISVRYQGWSNYGLLNKRLPTKTTPMSVLGGKNAWNALTEYAADNNIALYADIDLMRFRQGPNKKAIKNSFNKVTEIVERLRSVFATKLDLDSVKLLSPQYLSDTASTCLVSAQKQGLTYISLSTLGDLIYSNNTSKAAAHRYFFSEEIEKVLKQYRDSGMLLAVDGGNAYTLPYVSRVYSAPTMCSNFDVFDEEIPFYQIVLHGYVSMSAKPMQQANEHQYNVLKTAESGMDLLYGCMYEPSSLVTNTRYDHLYSMQYTLWMEQASSIATNYYEVQKKTHDQVIVDHCTLQTNVMLTEYANGIQVITNYTDKDVTVAGVEVKAMDYTVVQGVTV